MAGRGENIEAAAAEGGLENFPAEIKRAGEKLLHCFKNPMMGVISVWGVGKWGIAEYASRKSNDSHLFHVQILVQLLGEDFSFGKVQKEILRQLGMRTLMEGGSDDEESIDTQVATEIYNSLIRRKFLLVLGDVQISDINFELIGDPNLRRLLRNDSKIVLVGPKYLRSDMAINLEGLSIDMLHEEAASIARSPSIRGRFTPNTVLECFLYMLLFRDCSVKVDMLRWYWRGEGFLITEAVEEEDLVMFNKVEALLAEFQVRSMIERDGDSVTVPNSIAGTAKALVKWSKRSTHGRFWIEEGSLPEEDDKVKDIQRMVMWDIRELSTLTLKCSKLSTLFLVGEFVFRISDNFFEQIKNLRVLHLERIANESLPKSTSYLHNLRVLMLIDCPHLQTLLPSFRMFHQIEFLQISLEAFDSSPSIPDDIFQHMTNIRYLHLESLKITSLPSSISRLHNLRHLLLINCNYLISISDEFFEQLSQLRILDLHGNDRLESLPSSLSKLVNLRKLILYNCFSLKMGLPSHLQKLSALEVLDLDGCRSLQDIEDVTSSFGDILPNLRKLYISKIEAVRRLSLKGCESLEYVSLFGLTSLDVLDLSVTKIKTLPQGMSSAPHLRRLDMLHMSQIREIHWADISTELEELNFSQCGTWNSSNDVEQPRERGTRARIRVSNSKLLQSFSPSLKLWDSKCFSRFHIYISPCQEDEQGTGKSIHPQRRKSVYEDIFCLMQTRNLPCPRSHFNRCLEIRGGHRSPNGIHGVLSRAEFLNLCDNAFVQRLSDLGDVDKIKEMKECQVKRCERMEMFFEGDNASSDCLSHLQKIWMSNLASLRGVCEGTYGNRSFAHLNHIHLDYCLRLVTVFSSSVFLPRLETLEIKYCSKLETVFQGDASVEGSLQRLHTVCLWELPRLKSICRGTYMSALKKLKVRGCGMLKSLPLRPGHKADASTSTSGDRVVEGESEWWDCLKWEDERIQHLTNFEDPRPFRRSR